MKKLTDQEILEAARSLAEPLGVFSMEYTYPKGRRPRINAVQDCLKLLSEPVFRQRMFEIKLQSVQESVGGFVHQKETGKDYLEGQSAETLLAAIAEYRRLVPEA